MKTATLALSYLVALASASPAIFPFPTQQLATFDDLATTPGVSVTPVGSYKGLNYKSFTVQQVGVAGISTGVRAQSGQNVAANEITDQVLKGGPAFIADSVAAFDLQNLYFGCNGAAAESAGSVAVQCTVSFTAYARGRTTPFQTINQQFNPDNAVSSGMVRVAFPFTWAGLGRVEISIVQSSTPTTATALLIDSVSYRTYPL